MKMEVKEIGQTVVKGIIPLHSLRGVKFCNCLNDYQFPKEALLHGVNA
jgi:hypothetical protein